MSDKTRNYEIERGIQFFRSIEITQGDGTTAFDLTGATFLADVRLSQLPDDIRALPFGTGEFQTAFTCSAGTPTEGILTISLSIAQTEAMQRGIYDYDVVITFPSGDKRRILSGRLTVTDIASHV